MAKERSEYIEIVNEIEDKYSVNQWIHNGYHIWPILRIRLFLMIVRQFEGSRHGNENSKQTVSNIFRLIKNIPSDWFKYQSLHKKNPTIYVGATSHRVDYLGKKYNRFFDPLMDKDEKDNLLLEYSGDLNKDYYKSNRVLLISNLLKINKLYLKASDFFGQGNEYVRELNLLLIQHGLKINNFVPDTNRHITNVDRAILFFKNLLQKINPKKIYELCYYSTDLLGLNIAADRVGIQTIDMQHGPYHWAYRSWSSVPEDGYEALPDIFQAWDHFSANSVQEWATNTKKHSVQIVGNPWVEGWRNGSFISVNYKWPENIVLYTLQPTDEPLEPYLLNTIKKTFTKLNWWLRVHPRQKNELNSIENKLKDMELLDYVNIKDASELPLPEILMNTDIHLTKFSGCAIEAFNFGVPTILLDRRGKDIFENYFEYDIMKSYTHKSSEGLVNEINSYL